MLLRSIELSGEFYHNKQSGAVWRYPRDQNFVGGNLASLVTTVHRAMLGGVSRRAPWPRGWRHRIGLCKDALISSELGAALKPVARGVSTFGKVTVSNQGGREQVYALFFA